MAVIDPSWTPVEGQVGLYVETYESTNPFTGATVTRRILHSADGYCFYDLADQYCDVMGNIIPEEDVTPTMRRYYQYMSLASNRVLTDFISVPIEDGYEIVNVNNPPVTM